MNTLRGDVGDLDQTRRSSTPGVFRWVLGLLSVALLALVTLGYYALSTRHSLEARIGDIVLANDTRFAQLTETMRAETATAQQKLSALDSRFDEASQRWKTADVAASDLKRSDARLAKSVAANTDGLIAVKEDVAAQVATVTQKVDAVTADVDGVSRRVDAAQSALTASQREGTRKTGELTGAIEKNATAIADLRRQSEHDLFEFDIRKSGGNSVARVDDVKIQLTKADANSGRFSVALYVDDRRVERKDLLIGQLVQFIAGRERVRYDLVATAVDHDRVRGYVSVPKERARTMASDTTKGKP